MAVLVVQEHKIFFKTWCLFQELKFWNGDWRERKLIKRNV